MDMLSITTAFAFGYIVRQFGLPPLIGFLAAGFFLHALGVETNEGLERLADAGVTLLLFSIGLKLRLKSLLSAEVWAASMIHMALTIVLFGAVALALSAAGFSAFAGVDLATAALIGFALSFSSTVFAVKVFEERGEMNSFHGRVAIGILIMQDLFAVVFLTVSMGKVPSPWAIVVVPAIFLLRPLWGRLLQRCGHGEMLILLGFFLAMGIGASGFELVGLKADLGALLLGIIMAGHPKSPELAKSLLGFKDLFLVGFFLTIGLSGAPTFGAFGVALLLVALVIIKVSLFFLLLCFFRLRARTSLFGSLSLANYSEFGLLVASISVKNGWLANEWLIIMAIAVALSFVVASPLNTKADKLFARFADSLRRFEKSKRHPDDEPIDPGVAEIAVVGMGRIGSSTYDVMRKRYGDKVIGVDFDLETVERQNEEGRNVVLGDPTDLDFWERVKAAPNRRIKLIMFCLPIHSANLRAAVKARDLGIKGILSTIASFDDEVVELKEVGVDAAYNFTAEAGIGYADSVIEQFDEQLRQA